MTQTIIDPAITAEVIHEAVTLYLAEADNADDWWHSVPAPGYPLGVDVNIYYDPDDGIATREAYCYPNIEYQDKKGKTFLTTDTDRLIAKIPERDWLPATA